jgi:hypothetical protein
MTLNERQIETAIGTLLAPATLEAVEAERRTRHATVYICRTSHPRYRRVALKHDPSRGTEAVEIAYQGLRRYRESFARAGLRGVDAPEPIGWLPDPALVLSAYVPGIDFDKALHQAILCTGPSDFDHAVRRCGAALAALHAEPGSGDASRTLRATARRFRLSPDWVDLWKTELRPVVSAGDFAPNNVRVDGDCVYVLDPPTKERPTTTTAHSDIAFFLVELLKQTAGRAPLAGRSRGVRMYSRLAACFVHGYRDAGGIDARQPATRDLICWLAAYRASGAAIKNFRLGQSGRILQSLLLARWALLTRLKVKHSPWLPVR